MTPVSLLNRTDRGTRKTPLQGARTGLKEGMFV